jgi:tRNA 2-thiouridine synthesizing protein A
MSAESLDLRGEVCPMTFVRVRLWLEQAAIGSQLSIEVDYQPATQSIPRSLAILGQELMGMDEISEGVWRLQLRKRVLDPTEETDVVMEHKAHG